MEDGQIWVRPMDMFNSLVDKDKYPDVTQIYHFEIIEWKLFFFAINYIFNVGYVRNFGFLFILIIIYCLKYYIILEKYSIKLYTFNILELYHINI